MRSPIKELGYYVVGTSMYKRSPIHIGAGILQALTNIGTGILLQALTNIGAGILCTSADQYRSRDTSGWRGSACECWGDTWSWCSCCRGCSETAPRPPHVIGGGWPATPAWRSAGRSAHTSCSPADSCLPRGGQNNWIFLLGFGSTNLK